MNKFDILNMLPFSFDYANHCCVEQRFVFVSMTLHAVLQHV
jgi:hypothetical protein